MNEQEGHPIFRPISVAHKRFMLYLACLLWWKPDNAQKYNGDNQSEIKTAVYGIRGAQSIGFMVSPFT